MFEPIYNQMIDMDSFMGGGLSSAKIKKVAGWLFLLLASLTVIILIFVDVISTNIEGMDFGIAATASLLSFFTGLKVISKLRY